MLCFCWTYTSWDVPVWNEPSIFAWLKLGGLVDSLGAEMEVQDHWNGWFRGSIQMIETFFFVILTIQWLGYPIFEPYPPSCRRFPQHHFINQSYVLGHKMYIRVYKDITLVAWPPSYFSHFRVSLRRRAGASWRNRHESQWGIGFNGRRR